MKGLLAVVGAVTKIEGTHFFNSSIKAHNIIRQLLQLVQKARRNDNNIARVGVDDAEDAMLELFATMLACVAPLSPCFFPSFS